MVTDFRAKMANHRRGLAVGSKKRSSDEQSSNKQSSNVQSSNEQSKPADSHEILSALERELQTLRLELETHEQRANTAQHELDLLQRQLDTSVELGVQTILDKLFQEMSGPIAQLSTLDDLCNVQGKPLQAKDVLVVANRFVDSLKEYGVHLQGTISETVAFDPNLHEPLSLEEGIDQGEPVLVRMVGISYKGKVLRRAAVTRKPPDGGESTRKPQG